MKRLMLVFGFTYGAISAFLWPYERAFFVSGMFVCLLIIFHKLCIDIDNRPMDMPG